ncbi:MAG: DegV family protein [Anaerolineales bacterium]
MNLGLVTDSPADLPASLVERYQIEVVPATLIIAGKAYRDGIDLSRAEFYTRLPGMKSAPTTATPSPLEFASRYRKLLQAGAEHVLGIFTAERLTAIPNIARQAARDFPGQVTVLESGSLSLGIGFQVLAAAEAREQNLPLAAILAAVQSTRQRLKVAAALDTMDYLRRSGRLPAAVTALGGLLHIRPVVELREGQVLPLGAARASAQATRLLRQSLLVLGPLEKLAVLHTNAADRAREFLASLREAPGLPAQIEIVNVTTVIGTHVGPNGLGFAAVTA